MRSLFLRLVLLMLAGASAAPTPAGELTRLTHDGRLKFSPVFCDDGATLVYVDFEKPTLYRLKCLRLDSGECTALNPAATTSEFEPAWARRANVCAFAHTRGTLSVSVIVRAGAEQTAEIMPGGGFDGLRSPAVSPDGSQVLYCQSANGRQQIYAVAADGSNTRMLTDSEGNNNWPDFSPGGERIVFSSSRSGNYEIFVMNADGRQVRQLTDSPLQDIRPRISPDSRRIAFTSHRDGNAELYVMNTEGGDIRRVTLHEERDDYPAWHPSGHQLVAVCERAGEHDLYLIDVPEE